MNYRDNNQNILDEIDREQKALDNKFDHLENRVSLLADKFLPKPSAVRVELTVGQEVVHFLFSLFIVLGIYIYFNKSL